MTFIFVTASIAILTITLEIIPNIEAWRAERSWNRQMGTGLTAEPRKP